MNLRDYRGLVLVPSRQDQENKVADEEGEDHADEMGAELGFEGPVVPVHFITEAALEAAEAAGVRFFKSGFVHKQ